MTDNLPNEPPQDGLPDVDKLPVRKLKPMNHAAKEYHRGKLRHGLKSGKLPREAMYIENQSNKLRKNLEDAVLALHNDVTLENAAHIDTAIKWLRHGALCQRWLRTEASTMKPTEKIAVSREIASASERRDKAIAALDLDRDTQYDLISDLYNEPPRTSS